MVDNFFPYLYIFLVSPQLLCSTLLLPAFKFLFSQAQGSVYLSQTQMIFFPSIDTQNLLLMHLFRLYSCLFLPVFYPFKFNFTFFCLSSFFFHIFLFMFFPILLFFPQNDNWRIFFHSPAAFFPYLFILHRPQVADSSHRKVPENFSVSRTYIFLCVKKLKNYFADRRHGWRVARTPWPRLSPTFGPTGSMLSSWMTTNSAISSPELLPPKMNPVSISYHMTDVILLLPKLSDFLYLLVLVSWQFARSLLDHFPADLLHSLKMTNSLARNLTFFYENCTCVLCIWVLVDAGHWFFVMTSVKRIRVNKLTCVFLVLWRVAKNFLTHWSIVHH